MKTGKLTHSFNIIMAALKPIPHNKPVKRKNCKSSSLMIMNANILNKVLANEIRGQSENYIHHHHLRNTEWFNI